MYRTDKPETLISIGDWMNEAAPHVPPGTIYILIGNIILNSTAVLTETADAFAASNDILLHFRLSVASASENELANMMRRVAEAVINSDGAFARAQAASSVNIHVPGNTMPNKLAGEEKIKGICSCSV